MIRSLPAFCSKKTSRPSTQLFPWSTANNRIPPLSNSLRSKWCLSYTAANSDKDMEGTGGLDGTLFFAQQKSQPVIQGKPQHQQFQRQQSLPHLPIKEKITWTQLVSAAIRANMSQEARDQLCQENKESQGQRRGGLWWSWRSWLCRQHSPSAMANCKQSRGRSWHSRGRRCSVLQLWNYWRAVHNAQALTCWKGDSYYLWWPSDIFHHFKPINRSKG